MRFSGSICILALACLVSSSLAQTALPPSTLTEIERLLKHPGIQSGHVGISIQHSQNRQPLFEQNALKRFVPASNMKLFTAGFALSQLGADFRFRTQVLAAKVEFLKAGYWPKSTPNPVLLTLVGGNDPSLSGEDVRNLARQTAEKLGLKKGSTAIVRAQNGPRGDALNGENFGARYPDGWTLDDINWYYGAPVVGLSVNRNHVDVTVKGGEKIGDAATVETAPEAPFEIQSLLLTGPKSELNFDRDGETLVLTGQIEAGKTRTEGVAVWQPREWARQIFLAELQKLGVGILEPTVAIAPQDQEVAVFHDSAPLAELLKRFLKSSDNLYGELILRRAGTVAATPGKTESGVRVVSTGAAKNAHQLMAFWLERNQINGAGLRLSDGSGLSRYNLLTPRAVSDLLRHMSGNTAFYEALPIAGVDGTLKNRMKGSPAEGNVRAKTGTFSIVNCLSGYVTTRDGKRLCVSILTNGIEDGELARRWQGRVFATLASAKWEK